MGIPFEIPPGAAATVDVVYQPPGRPVTEDFNGEQDITLYFDHLTFREATVTVKYCLKAGPVRTSLPR